ncbi:GDSL esterase/lipase LTL1 [Lolium perenne]|uniref:GDSL esterase/lipase LTL1 n=1 Tax=Lolium perenne TaxID=4522 RepID=UPI0021F54DAE|nr:GDSL esterase/lipase LTL1-like [Lolium perenne]
MAAMAASSPAVSTVLAAVAVALLLAAAGAPTASAARAFFVFGDSLVDNGNNNYLVTTARADAPPYGIDYPTHMPTGRFSNGLNIPDIISEYLESEPALPYLSPYLRGDQLLVGANFASAGVGILNDTGVQFVNIIRIGQQLQNFEDYQRRLAGFIGEDAARQRVNQALVLITLGGNDFVNNYYLVPFSARSQQYEIHDYVPFIISEYKKVLARLYELGARRVIVTGTGMIGCVPAELALHSLDGSCAPDLTRAADLFNPQLEQMLTELNGEVGHDNVFIAANTNRASFDFLFNPQQYGFVTAKVACCGQGPYNGIGLCTPASNVCANRDVYAYWDAFHPTERANRIIVGNFMHGSTDHISPMNLSTILAMDSRN